MIRDLHPHTKPQRATSPGNVPQRARRLGYEPSDFSPGRIAQGLAALFLFLGIVMAALALLNGQLAPEHSSVSAYAAKMRFRSPAPPLETGQKEKPRELNVMEERELTRPGPGEQAVDAAMKAVAGKGWGEEAPPPSPAEVARERAEAGQ